MVKSIARNFLIVIIMYFVETEKLHYFSIIKMMVFRLRFLRDLLLVECQAGRVDVKTCG